MTDYGIKISQDGYGVGTSNIEDLVMTSKANQWKVHTQGEVTFTGTAQTIQVEHGLGYTPGFLVLFHSKYWTGTDEYRYAWTNPGAWNANGTYLNLRGQLPDDRAMYVIFKDFGA